MMSSREYPDRPVVGVGAIVIKEGRVLLVRRGIHPGKGLWAIPGGGLKLGETLQQGAEREIEEETGVAIRAGDPVYSFDFFDYDEEKRLRYHYVIVDMMGEYISGEPQGGDDAQEARWLAPGDLAGLNVSVNTIRVLKALNFL
jgi:8-oxo-dGTP diphosphatase